jgi:hypothetical protein
VPLPQRYGGGRKDGDRLACYLSLVIRLGSGWHGVFTVSALQPGKEIVEPFR